MSTATTVVPLPAVPGRHLPWRKLALWLGAMSSSRKPEIVVLSVGFSALIGLIFGLYPAQQASRFDPVEALRYE